LIAAISPAKVRPLSTILDNETDGSALLRRSQRNSLRLFGAFILGLLHERRHLAFDFENRLDPTAGALRHRQSCYSRAGGALWNADDFHPSKLSLRELARSLPPPEQALISQAGDGAQWLQPHPASLIFSIQLHDLITMILYNPPVSVGKGDIGVSLFKLGDLDGDVANIGRRSRDKEHVFAANNQRFI
jgi:hypothetical protein